MTQINELPTILANQIAAGEVVERPASVVKELVENSIDANSTEVNVSVTDAGLKNITVIDDGDGIDASQIEKAFLRHATSKISEQRDLFRVRSLGFRGEALPSIASVAKVELKTSTGVTGVQVNYEGGKLMGKKAAELRKGTTVSVSSLFFNTPARLKYMSSQNTELAKISDVINRLSLAHPEVAFSFSSNGRELLRTSGRADEMQVLGAIYGIKTLSKMVRVGAERDDVKVTGFVSLPELTRASRNYISLILNGRFIKNYGLTKAVISGYGSKLMIGRFPIAVISITVDPALVDVNVHPTKQEVRISNEREISNLIYEAISSELQDKQLIPDVREQLDDKVTEINQQTAMNVVTENRADFSRPATSDSTTDPAIPDETAPDIEPVVIKTRDDLNDPRLSEFENRVEEAGQEASLATVDQQPKQQKPENQDLELREANPVSGFPTLTYIGQIHGTYLVAETEEGMYLVDQHAAQERVNYEHYRKAIGEVSSDQQKLLVPIVLDYSTTDFLLIQEKMPLLNELGIYLEDFGQNSFVVRQHPMWFKEGQEESTLREMIDWIITDHKISVAAFREKTAIMMSCKRAIKANHHLDEQQAKALLAKLPECENPYNCPHGRPVLVKFTNTDIEKMFKRIQDPHNTKEEIF